MSKREVVLRRALKGAVASFLGALAAWLSGPEVLALVGAGNEALVMGLVVPAVLAINKYLTYEE